MLVPILNQDLNRSPNRSSGACIETVSAKGLIPVSLGVRFFTFLLQDAVGNVAGPGIRHVFVACKSPTVLCTASDSSLYCSTSSGLCIPSVTTSATPAPSYPTIKLIGQAVLGVTQGSSYLACPETQPTNVICDRLGLLAVGQQGVESVNAGDVLYINRFIIMLICLLQLRHLSLARCCEVSQLSHR